MLEREGTRVAGERPWDPKGERTRVPVCGAPLEPGLGGSVTVGRGAPPDLPPPSDQVRPSHLLGLVECRVPLVVHRVVVVLLRHRRGGAVEGPRRRPTRLLQLPGPPSSRPPAPGNLKTPPFPRLSALPSFSSLPRSTLQSKGEGPRGRVDRRFSAQEVGSLPPDKTKPPHPHPRSPALLVCSAGGPGSLPRRPPLVAGPFGAAQQGGGGAEALTSRNTDQARPDGRQGSRSSTPALRARPTPTPLTHRAPAPTYAHPFAEDKTGLRKEGEQPSFEERPKSRIPTSINLLRRVARFDSPTARLLYPKRPRRSLSSFFFR